MENLVNAASSFVQNQGQNQGGNSGGNNSQGGFDIGSLVGAATSHQQGNNQGGSGGFDASQFSSIASNLLSNHDQIAQGDHPSESELKDAHDKVQSDQPVDSNQIGASAAIKAIQSVMGNGQAQSQDGNNGDIQSKLIGVAMSHANQIFESKQAQGLIDKASKNQAVQQAGQTVMKMIMKQQLESQAGGLGSLASKFIN